MVRKMIAQEFLRTNAKNYIIGFITLVSSSVLALMLPKMLGYITDGLADKTLTLNQVYLTAFYMLVMGVAIFIMKFIFRALIIGKSRDLECFLRSRLFEHLQSLPAKFYNENKTGDLMAYVINDLNAIRMAFAIGIVFFIDGVILNVFSVAIMAQTINAKLTAVAILPVAVSIFIVFWLRKQIRRKFMFVQEAYADLSDKIQENITGIRVVKSFVQEEKEIEKLSCASMKRYKVQMDYVRLSALLQPLIAFNFGVSFTLVIIYGGISAVNGTISVGDFVTVNSYLLLLIGPLSQLSRTVEIWQKAFASIRRLDEIFAQKTDITDEKADVTITKLDGSVEFRNLTFSYASLSKYPNKNVLKNISFKVESGKTLGIIGSTGSGKTTIMNVLLRLYKISDGQVFLDGHDINHIPLSVIRTNIGFVPQDNFLFATSINENVKFFDELIRSEAVIDSTKLACVYDNILQFPEEFETIVGERGITLSGGQKQRLSIARAVVKDPEILILDDSLSAVDTSTEEHILANIKHVLEGKTGIIIAHRVSTIKHCDEIIFLDDGEIKERGTHEELLALRGEYYRLNKIQALESELKHDTGGAE